MNSPTQYICEDHEFVDQPESCIESQCQATCPLLAPATE
jgi:hypothetical protein